MTTKAMPLSVGMALKKRSRASSPPAEAPIPTMKLGASETGASSTGNVGSGGGEFLELIWGDG